MNGETGRKLVAGGWGDIEGKRNTHRIYFGSKQLYWDFVPFALAWGLCTLFVCLWLYAVICGCICACVYVYVSVCCCLCVECAIYVQQNVVMFVVHTKSKCYKVKRGEHCIVRSVQMKLLVDAILRPVLDLSLFVCCLCIYLCIWPVPACMCVCVCKVDLHLELNFCALSFCSVLQCTIERKAETNSK